MSQDDEVRERLLAIFRVEAREHLHEMVAHLMTLQRGADSVPTKDAVEGLFRATHTLKGAARSVGMEEIEAPCQAVEGVMGRLAREEMPLTPALIDLLQDAVAHVARSLTGTQDAIVSRALIGRLETAASGPIGPIASPSQLQPRPEAMRTETTVEGTIRVSTSMLDTFIFRAEDLSAAKLAAAERVQQAGALNDAIAFMRSRVGVNADMQAIETSARELRLNLKQDAQGLARAVDALQHDLRQIRMAPASTILDLLPLMVHDLARDKDKEVDLSIQGADYELDRRVLETVKDPLIHLVRNAVDHGIESPAARVAVGKTARGRLSLRVDPRDGQKVEIQLADDGAGLDLSEVRAAAVRARIMSAEEAQALPDEQAQDLVFRSGLSTSPIVTRVSGQGLGMAIVRERVEGLGGSVRLESHPQQGTTVTMVIPATITTFQGLMVRESGQRFLIPLDAIERISRVALDQVHDVEGRPHILRDGNLLPCCRLRAILQLADDGGTPESKGQLVCVSVRSDDRRVALLVDEIEGSREALVKELAAPLIRVRNVAGAGMLGTGEIVMILRATDLVHGDHADVRPAAFRGIERRRQAVVLVVDDSITTRTVEKNILEMAGFEVRVAADGIEAWDTLMNEACDLVVSDVDMPRMNGFELTERLRAHPKYKDVPIILVTALESRTDKEQGIRLGANAYLFKSSFADSNLLDIVRRLI